MTGPIEVLARIAARDRRLTELSLRVLLALPDYLLHDEYRPLKLEAVAHDLGATNSNVWRSVKRLEQCGYIRAGYKDPSSPQEARSRKPDWFLLLWAPQQERMKRAA